MEVELRSALEDRNRAQADASESNLAQDDVVSQARNDRDSAIQRRTKAEIELAKTRVELMQANSELLEAINQKVELSQQLEQWQVSVNKQSALNLIKWLKEIQLKFQYILMQKFAINYVDRTISLPGGHARIVGRANETPIGR